MQMGHHLQVTDIIEGNWIVSGELSASGEFSTTKWRLAACDGTERRYQLGDRKRYLLMFKLLIRDSSVERGMPSRAAAPSGPDTRPRLWASAFSIISFSRSEREARPTSLGTGRGD